MDVGKISNGRFIPETYGFADYATNDEVLTSRETVTVGSS